MPWEAFHVLDLIWLWIWTAKTRMLQLKKYELPWRSHESPTPCCNYFANSLRIYECRGSILLQHWSEYIKVCGSVLTVVLTALCEGWVPISRKPQHPGRVTWMMRRDVFHSWSLGGWWSSISFQILVHTFLCKMTAMVVSSIRVETWLKGLRFGCSSSAWGLV